MIQMSRKSIYLSLPANSCLGRWQPRSQDPFLPRGRERTLGTRLGRWKKALVAAGHVTTQDLGDKLERKGWQSVLFVVVTNLVGTLVGFKLPALSGV